MIVYRLLTVDSVDIGMMEKQIRLVSACILFVIVNNTFRLQQEKVGQTHNIGW